MVVRASILMNRRLFLFSTACNPCNFESTRTLRRLDSNASPSRLVEGIGVDSATPPTRLGEVSESSRRSTGVESGKSSTPQHVFPYPKLPHFPSKTMRFITQKCHTFDPKLPWFWPLSMGVLMFKSQGCRGEVMVLLSQIIYPKVLQFITEIANYRYKYSIKYLYDRYINVKNQGISICI